MQIEHAGATGEIVVFNAGTDSQFVFAYQRLVEAGCIMAVKDGRQHLQRIRLAVFFDFTQQWHFVAHQQNRQFSRRFDVQAANALLWWLAGGPARR